MSMRFSHRTTLSARKLASFWQEKHRFITRFCKNVVVSKQVKITISVLAFFDSQKAQLLEIRITEQPIILTKRKINRPGINFLSIFTEI